MRGEARTAVAIAGLPYDARASGRDVFVYIRIVPTTVHIPERLLDRVDARAKALGVSRNRLIVEALEEKLAPHATWPPELVKLLSQPADPQIVAATREFERAIEHGRRSRRRPPRF